MNYLPLSLVEKYIPIMRRWGVSEVARSPRGFIAAYRKAGGKKSALSEQWQRKRDAFVARHMAQVKKRGEPLWKNGAPTRRHLALIAWAYSPTPGKVKSYQAYKENGEYYTVTDEPIEEVSRRWADDDIWEKAYDAQVHAWYPIEDVLPYREYRWTREAARRSPEEWDELKESMESEGWDEDQPLFMLVGRDGNVKVGEGNHRLAIAYELGFEEVPVQFQFYQEVSGGKRAFKKNGYVENPPWTDRILRDNADEIYESGFPQPANLIGGIVSRKGSPQELGAGSYGAVYATEDPDVVFKVTSDSTEVNFIRAAMKIGHWPEGIVKYKAVIDFPEKFRKRDTFGIWREAAFPVGLQDGMDYVKTTYDEVELQEFNFYLRWFLANAGIARDTLKRVKNPAKTYEDSKRYKQWAWDNIGPAEAKPPWKYFGQRTVFFAESFKGAQRVAAALRACEVIAEEMGSTAKMNYVGDALGFYLNNGILLADVHGDNVGMVDRGEDYVGRIWVITDPGHAVFLDEL
jgi:hypothetical protein